MMQLKLAEIAAMLASEVGDGERIAAGYSIDSRSLKPNDLFFAVRGPHFDGHNFVNDALAAGAAGAVVEQAGYQKAQGRDRLIPVRDTTQALARLANSVRKRWGGKVVGITGSTGKTTTKEMIAAALAVRYGVLKTAGNLNNQYGVPLTLLRLNREQEFAVLEMGMSAAGEIRTLARIAEPETGVVTNVAAVHLAFFESVEGIARAKRELIEGLVAPATAVLNFDDERVRSFSRGFEGRVIYYGFSPLAGVRALSVRPARAGDRAGVQFQVAGEFGSGDCLLPLPGRHNVENALAAIAVAGLHGVPPQAACAALENLPALDQRSQVLKLPGGAVLINDSYNSSPRALGMMLETLRDWPGARRRRLIAGEMLELGPTSPELHREMGRRLPACGVEQLFAVQGDARWFMEGALEAGMSAAQMGFFESPEEAAKACGRTLQEGDVVLVKGSRGVHLEKAVEVLLSTAAGKG